MFINYYILFLWKRKKLTEKHKKRCPPNVLPHYDLPRKLETNPLGCFLFPGQEYKRLGLYNPVFQFDIGNSAKFAGVVRDDNDVSDNYLPCDLDIVHIPLILSAVSIQHRTIHAAKAPANSSRVDFLPGKLFFSQFRVPFGRL